MPIWKTKTLNHKIFKSQFQSSPDHRELRQHWLPSLLLTNPVLLLVMLHLNSPSLTIMRKIIFPHSWILGKKSHKWKSQLFSLFIDRLGFFFFPSYTEWTRLRDMNPLSHALFQKSSIPTIRHCKPGETLQAWLHCSRPQARVAAPSWRRPCLPWLLFIFLFSVCSVVWQGAGHLKGKPPQRQTSVPGPRKPSSVSHADRSYNLHELKSFNLS